MGSGGSGKSIAADARDEWVDAARGIAIIMVVFLHVIFNYAGEGLQWRWSGLAGMLETFRMPLFFFAAGIFAGRSLALPFGRMAQRRLLHLLWLYLVWSIIGVLAALLVPMPAPEGPVWLQMLSIFIVPSPATWFLWALALHTLIGWCVRRLHVGIQLAGSAALAVIFGSDLATTGDLQVDKTLYHLFFFLLALNSSTLVRRLAGRVTVLNALALVALYGVVGVVVVKFGIEETPGVRLVASIVAVAAGCALAVVLARLAAFAWLSALGRRTLPVYALHWYAIAALYAIVNPLIPHLGGFLTAVAAPVMTAAAIALCLLGHRWTARIPGLYARPAWAVRPTVGV